MSSRTPPPDAWRLPAAFDLVSTPTTYASAHRPADRAVGPRGWFARAAPATPAPLAHADDENADEEDEVDVMAEDHAIRRDVGSRGLDASASAWVGWKSRRAYQVHVSYARRSRGATPRAAFFASAHERAAADGFAPSSARALVAVFATRDETVLGRCLAVQASGAYADEAAAAFVTIADARLDARRLLRVVGECENACGTRVRPNPVNAYAWRRRLRDALWSATASWGASPAARPPDASALFARHAPRPLPRRDSAAAGGGGVPDPARAVATVDGGGGGRYVVATVGAGTLDALVDLGAHASRRENRDAKRRALARVRVALAEHGADVDRDPCVVACQTTPCGAFGVRLSPTCVAFAGVPLASVADAFPAPGGALGAGRRVEDVSSPDVLRADLASRTERAEARETARLAAGASASAVARDAPFDAPFDASFDPRRI